MHVRQFKVKKTYYYALGSLKRQHEKKEKRDIKNQEWKNIFLQLMIETKKTSELRNKYNAINKNTEDFNEKTAFEEPCPWTRICKFELKESFDEIWDEAIPFCCFYYYLYFNLLHVYLFDTRVVMVIFQHFLSVLWLI